MSDIKKLLETKKKIASKRPDFCREGSQNSVRIGTKWRKPRGLQSKMRHKAAGHRKTVTVGFGCPSAVRGMDLEGFELVHIENLSSLSSLDPKVHKIILGSNLGAKKKIILLEELNKKGFKVHQFKDISKKVDSLKDSLKLRKDKKIAKASVKKEKKAKSSAKPELEEKVLSVEEKKKQDQKEMEKVLTKRD